MSLDNILIKLGEFGKYQKLVLTLTCVSSVSVGLYGVMSVIFLNTPQHRCKIPGLGNDTYDIHSAYQQNLVNNYIPPSDDASHDYDQCHLYSFDYNNVKFDNSSRPINASLVKCNEWVYSESIFVETFTSKYNIVCENAHITSLIKSLFFVGKFLGAFVFGTLSDSIGRKKTFYISLLMFFGIAFGSSWSSSHIIYAVLTVGIGATTQGVFIVGFVLGVEVVGPSKRKLAGMIMQYSFAIGLVALACVSYLARHWFYINIICSAPAAIFLFYWWLIPESPRWLITKQRYEEANVILQKIAKINKVAIKRDMFDNIMETEPAGRIWQLFSSRVMFLRTIIILFNWCIVSMTYYGLYLNAGNLGGNFFLNMFLSGLVEFPGDTLIILLVDRIGRKTLYCLSMVLGGCACASTIIPIMYGEIENQIIIVVLAMIGKFGVSMAFNTLYLFSAELFPTVVRNAGMGASCCSSRIGGILAPYIADSAMFIGGMVGKVFPLAVFGVMSILAGLSSLHLPETLNMELPETIKDGIMFGKRRVPICESENTLLESTTNGQPIPRNNHVSSTCM
ncbi:organic cation transporter protein-like [Ylistrum balloti]|uniref:organic cation transporter protein-like n=1 Tax=Ylistrum balloti TaxID=509963 RepID=UPI002905E047|nr:organic cation transporter protein-like [Ylistrum balloti]